MLLALGEKPIFKKVVEGLPSDEAHELESSMIQKIGTIESGAGPLSNLIYRGKSRKGLRSAIDICFENIAKV